MIIRTSLLLVLTCASVAAMAAERTHSGEASRQAGTASTAASGSAAHSIAASGQVTSAAIAVPLSVGAGVLISGAAVSAGAAGASMNAATAPIGTPLEVTNEAITVMPPNEALRVKN